MDLKGLRIHRRRQFWGEIIPYLGYVMQSGVAVMFLFMFIAFSAWYTSLIQHIPAGLPIRWIMLVVLLPLTVQSSFRTYLQFPDIVFLLPQESKMKSYLSGSWISGVTYKLVGLTLVFLTAWPLYSRSDIAPKPFWTFLILLFILKMISSYGGWKELSMVSIRASKGYRLLRWAVMALALWAWLWQPVGKSLIYVLLLVATYVVSLSSPVKHLVAWERLISKEQSQIGRVMLVLGWFVNVPERQQRVYPRRLLSKVGSQLSWVQSSAYRYLITKSFVRSDIFGIIMRACVLGILLVWWTRGSLLGSGIYLFFLFLVGIQLSSLQGYHRDSFWLNIYPIPANSRQHNVMIFVFQVHLLLAVILWLPLWGDGWTHVSLTMGTLAAGIVMSILIRGVLSRKINQENDED
ncbi:ABC transporter permease [Paenibacillus sp. FA6]|uniref:ABC transporter permease n=1 Tax=Paenibacillus sp. FA6 TaxID=3413029 RepID=UPI003F65E68F